MFEGCLSPILSFSWSVDVMLNVDSTKEHNKSIFLIPYTVHLFDIMSQVKTISYENDSIHQQYCLMWLRMGDI